MRFGCLLMILILLLTDVVLALLYDELLFLSHNPMMAGCCVVLSDKDLLMVSVM